MYSLTLRDFWATQTSVLLNGKIKQDAIVVCSTDFENDGIMSLGTVKFVAADGKQVALIAPAGKKHHQDGSHAEVFVLVHDKFKTIRDFDKLRGICFVLHKRICFVTALLIHHSQVLQAGG